MKRVSSGYSAVEGLIIVTFIVLVGLVGYNLYSMNQAHTNSAAEQQATANQVPPAPEISTESDLDTATETLDAVDVDQNQSDLEQLDRETAF
ncbi:MAG: hypothetical protein ABIQ64_03645 [Candidatus Saccharimonadales bacterium]